MSQLRIVRSFGLLLFVTLSAIVAVVCGFYDGSFRKNPWDLYGQCDHGYGDGNGLFYSSSQAAALLSIQHGIRPSSILASKVFECKPYGAFDSADNIPCPSAAFTFCFSHLNDGLANAIKMGVVEARPNNDPNTKYTGCQSSSQTQKKLTLFRETGIDPMSISGLFTISCANATSPGKCKARKIRCPGDNLHPFAYCVSTDNDGLGNAVILGVITANGPGDPYGLVGNCAYKQNNGYRRKSQIVTDAGKSLEKVYAIFVNTCGCCYTGTPPGVRLGGVQYCFGTYCVLYHGPNNEQIDLSVVEYHG
jgi:hypothetical protein